MFPPDETITMHYANTVPVSSPEERDKAIMMYMHIGMLFNFETEHNKKSPQQ